MSTSTNTITASEKASFDEYEAIEAALQPYMQAAVTGDGALSVSTFMDDARVIGSANGQLYNVSKDGLKGMVSSGGPSPNVRSRITWIDVSGPAAAARVEFYDWGGMRYTDFFVLYKSDNAWKISGKVYDSHSKN